MADLVDFGIPLLILLSVTVLPLTIVYRRHRLAKRYFDYAVVNRGWVIPIPLPFLVGAVRKYYKYSGTCKVCGSSTPVEGATMFDLVGHAKMHRKAGVAAP